MPTALKRLEIARDVLDALPDKALDAADLDPVLLHGRLERALSVPARPAGGAVFDFTTGSALTVSVFNSEDDDDPDGVLGPASDDAAGLIPFDPSHAWVKTRAEATVRGTAGSAASPGFEVAAGAAIVLADYRIHPRSDSARAAVTGNLARPRFAVRVDDVLALEPDEALMYRVAGSVRMDLTLRWSDIVAGKARLLGTLVPAGHLAPVRVAAESRLDVSVRVDDEFLLVFAGVEAGRRYRVTLRKAGRRGRSVGVGARVSVSLADPDQAADAASRVLDAVLDDSEAEVRAAVDAALARSPLSEEQRERLGRVLDRLGLPAGEDAAALLKDRLDELRAAAGRVVEEAARSKVELGFRYEYSRLATKSAVLQAVLTADAVREFHNDLIRFRLAPVLEAARQEVPGVSLESFLGQKTVETRRSWGFSLGLGRWRFGGRDARAIRTVEEEDAAGNVRVSYLGSRGYDGTWAGSSRSWSGDLAVATDDFVPPPRPRVSDYQLGIHLLWQGSVRRLNDNAIREELDTALVWGALAPGQLDEARRALEPAIGKEAELATQLTIGHDAMSRMLAYVHEHETPGFAAALAVGLPRVRRRRAREEILLRRDYYQPLWAHYLENPSLSPQNLAATAREHLRRQRREAALAHWEGDFRPGEVYTLAGVVYMNPGIPERCAAFRSALGDLAEAFQRQAPDDDVIANVFHGLSGCWQFAILFRAAGAYLVELAGAAGALEEVERSVVVAFEDQVVVLSSA